MLSVEHRNLHTADRARGILFLSRPSPVLTVSMLSHCGYATLLESSPNPVFQIFPKRVELPMSPLLVVLTPAKKHRDGSRINLPGLARALTGKELAASSPDPAAQAHQHHVLLQNRLSPAGHLQSNMKQFYCLFSVS